MTESELLTRNPQSNIHAPHQHSQQQLQQPSTSLLLNVNVSRPEASHTTNLVNTLETNYQIIVERFGGSSLKETTQFLTSNSIDPKEAKHLIDGFFCGVLVDPQNAEKHFTCLKTIAISTDQWMGILTSFNMLALEEFPFMKNHCKQQLIYFIDEALKLQKTSIDSSVTNICRALSDGTDFRETCQIVHQFAHRLLASHQRFSSFPRNSTFPPTAFALFSRFISDAQLVANSGVMNCESFKAPLVEICVILVRERFSDLLQLGHDLFLLLLRLSRVTQFLPVWRDLLHHPTILVPKYTGLQQILNIPTSTSLLNHRVSLRISRKMSDILKISIRITTLGNSTLPTVKQLQADLNRQFDALKAMHLSGPDSGSVRAEIIRHVWAFTEQKEFNNQHSIEARANLLGWLLRTAKPGAELQWCKLAFFWEWFGFDPSVPNAHVSAEPIISTIRHLLHTGHTPLGNSLIDFLIKSTNVLYPPLSYFFVNSIIAALKSLEQFPFLQVHSVFVNTKLDQILRDQFRTIFCDFFPKRLTSIADNLAAPSSIIDFDAIRQTTTNSSTGSTTKQQNFDIAEQVLQQREKQLQQEKNNLINGKGSNVTSSSSNERQQIKSEIKMEAGVEVANKRLVKNVLNSTTLKNEKEGGGSSSSSVGGTTVSGVGGTTGGSVGGTTNLRTTTNARRPPQIVDAPPLKKQKRASLMNQIKEEVAEKQQNFHQLNKIKEKKKKEGVIEKLQKIDSKKIEETVNINNLKISNEMDKLLNVRPSESNDSLTLTIAEDDEEEEEGQVKEYKEKLKQVVEEEKEEEEEEEQVKEYEEIDLQQQSTSKRLPLISILPMVREEFREHLEALYKAVKKKKLLQQKQHNSDYEDITFMQRLLDSIFDANEMECDQTEYIALCLLRILESYLEQSNSYLTNEEPSIEEISEFLEHPLFRFFKTLCLSGEETDTRRFLLGILKKMIEECHRIGYLFLLFLSSIERENRRLSRGSDCPTVDQAVETYKNVCEAMDVEWERQLAKDLEQCSFDDYQLFSHILVNVLARLTPFGPPTKIMRLICGGINPRLLSRLMSEIVRENIVMFGGGNVLTMLIDSLKWDSLEQIMLWQMLQTEAVEFDKFIDILQRLNYKQHPEATAAIIVIMRNMEPNPDIAVMKNLVRNLLLRPPNEDLFTVDAIKLLIDYDENIPPVATCISKMMKKVISTGDIKANCTSPSGHSSTKIMKNNNRVLTAEYIFGHLDNLRKHCMEKDSHSAENFLKNQLLLDMAMLVKRNPKAVELKNKFDELFALFDIMLEEEQVLNAHGGKLARRKANNNNKKKYRDGTPTKRKRKATKESESDDDY